MEKKFKRVPFDLELAKDIQSGKTEGRIVTNIYGNELCNVRIICWDRKDIMLPLIGLYETYNHEEGCVFFNEKGLDPYCDREVVYIKLPEEAPKHEFQVGDKVLCFGHDDDEVFEIKEIKENYAYLNDGQRMSFDSMILYYRPKNNEFKPFDKVLVRCSVYTCWQTAFYSHYIKDNNDDKHYVTTSGAYYKGSEILPYIGNERLVGTTNNPE